MLFHRMTQSDYPLNVCVCLLYREKIVKVKNDDDNNDDNNDDENEDVRGRRPFRKKNTKSENNKELLREEEMRNFF